MKTLVHETRAQAFSYIHIFMLWLVYVLMQANRLTPVLACEDRMLRVLDRSTVLHNVEVDAIPVVLHLNGNEGGEAGDEILYGTADGRVGLVRVGR
jgi:hypothetical protein